MAGVVAVTKVERDICQDSERDSTKELGEVLYLGTSVGVDEWIGGKPGLQTN